MNMLRRHFLLSTAACAIALTPGAALAAFTPPSGDVGTTKKLLLHPNERALTPALVDDALRTVLELWDYPSVAAQAFGYPMWSVYSTNELRHIVVGEALDSRDTLMCDRIMCWLQLGEYLDRKFGPNNGLVKVQWLRSTEMISRYDALDYVVSGSPGNLTAVLDVLQKA